jgi:uncharacterized membrane protein YdjX (TVP38/TMEM64 family)
MRNRFILVGLILGIAALGYFAGLFQYLAPDRLRELLTEAGAWGPVVIVVLFTLLEPFGTPGAFFILAAATLWPFWAAFAINWIGATGAGMFGFAFARYLGRDWVEGRMPDRLRRWDERLSERGLPIVIAFRLMFFLNPASHWALGLSRVSMPTAVLGTVIGLAPGVAVLTYFGAEILVWLEAQSVGTWIAFALVVTVAIAFGKYRGRASAVDTG